MEFTVEQWDGLKNTVIQEESIFMLTILKVCCRFVVKYWNDKMENWFRQVINKELLDHVRTKMRAYVSTGMLTSEEVNELYAYMSTI